MKIVSLKQKNRTIDFVCPCNWAGFKKIENLTYQCENCKRIYIGPEFEVTKEWEI